jgi:phosphoglycolate phosphatase
MDIELVFLDLDGTLIDTIEDIGNAMNRALERHGLPPHPLSDYPAMVGNGLRKAATCAVPPGFGRGPRFEALVSDFLAEYASHPLDLTSVYPGVPLMLSRIADMGVRTAICTNKRTDIAERIVEKLLGFHRFFALVGESEGRRKPDPEGVREIMARATSASGRAAVTEVTVLLGDSEVDIQTARAAGVFPAGALWGYRSEEQLTSAGAREVFPDPESFLRWVEERGRREAVR